MFGRKHEIPRLQSDFYRDYYHKIMRGLVLSTSVIVLLLLAIIYFVLFQPPTDYYASTTTGLIIPMQPANT